jgi:hypothetical protein
LPDVAILANVYEATVLDGDGLCPRLRLIERIDARVDKDDIGTGIVGAIGTAAETEKQKRKQQQGSPGRSFSRKHDPSTIGVRRQFWRSIPKSANAVAGHAVLRGLCWPEEVK